MLYSIYQKIVEQLSRADRYVTGQAEETVVIPTPYAESVCGDDERAIGSAVEPVGEDWLLLEEFREKYECYPPRLRERLQGIEGGGMGWYKDLPPACLNSWKRGVWT